MKTLYAIIILLAACAHNPPDTADGVKAQSGTITISTASSSSGITKSIDTPLYAGPLACGSRVWPDQWNTWLNEALTDYGQHLLPAKISVLCPRYQQMTDLQRRAFWVLFSATVICNESSFNPNDRYWEKFGVWSEGLWQLSYGDERGHKRCEISSAKGNILDPRTNLRCGIAILDDQLANHPVFYDQSYWSTLRDSMDGAKTRKLWWEWQGMLPFCNIPPTSGVIPVSNGG